MCGVFWHDAFKAYLKGFHRTTVLILDAPQTMTKPAGDAFVEKHDYNCRKMQEFFVKYSDAEIVPLHMPRDSGKTDFYKRIDDVLAGKTSEDLVIVYFEGIAYGENEKYHWDLRSGPDRVKGYKVIQHFYDTEAFCMLWLDCHTHDRLRKKMIRCNDGNTEMITTTTQHKDTSCKTGYSPGNDFTDGILVGLADFVDGLVAERQDEEAAEERGRPRKPKKLKALQTMPMILKSFKNMFANANRPDRKRTKAGGEEVIWRFMIDPNRVKQTGKIEFIAKLLQGDVGQGSEAPAVDDIGEKIAENVGEGDPTAEDGEAAAAVALGYPPPIVEDDEDEGYGTVIGTATGNNGTNGQ